VKDLATSVVSAPPATPRSEGIPIRACTTLAELEQCVELQKTVWGYSELDMVPVQIFIVALKTGGHVLGAFDEGSLVGFALAFSAARSGFPYVHSHLVAVLPKYRDRGVGRSLKLAQRDECLRNGIRLIEWTFDPLEIKNAQFNIARLGGIARKFIPNLYGVTTSHLHGNLPTDRLLVEWQLDSERVAAAAASTAPKINEKAIRISLPAGIGKIKQENPTRAQQVQSGLRAEFGHWFGKGYAVTGFEMKEDIASYILEAYAD
jgi:predicted GNAT superfamily acetyltransferase